MHKHNVSTLLNKYLTNNRYSYTKSFAQKGWV